MRARKRLREQEQRLAQFTAENPDGPWGPSQWAVDAGCRAFAGRATSGFAHGHDVLVTVWAGVPRRSLLQRLRGEPEGPPSEPDYCIDIYSPTSAPDAIPEELDRSWTQIGLTLPEVVAWCEPHSITWLPPLLAERAGGWFIRGGYDRDSPTGLPEDL
jgi:hypothetical protein